MIRVAIVQRSCPHYRIQFFRKLNKNDQVNISVLVNDPRVIDLEKNDIGFNLVYVPSIHFNFAYKTKTYRVPLSFNLITHLWRQKYDVVIVEGVTNILNNLLIYPISRLMHSRFIWWGAGRRRNASKNIFRHFADPFAKYLITHADACIAYGSVARDYMISVGAAPEKVIIAQNTIDTSRLVEQRANYIDEIREIREQFSLVDKKVILYVGVIEARKKLENLILAFDKLSDMNLPSVLIIVGDGPHLDKVKSWTNDHHPDLNIRFLGKIIDGVEPYFAMCDVFVLPSEGGLALNQAMAFGKPVIATSADGTEVDLIKSGENGFLVNEDDISALALSITQVLTDPILQNKMGSFSAELMDNRFTLDNMTENFFSAIENAFANGNNS